MHNTKEREAYSLLRSSLEELETDHLPDPKPQGHRILRASTCVHVILLVVNAVLGIFLLQQLIQSSPKLHLIHCKLFS